MKYFNCIILLCLMMVVGCEREKQKPSFEGNVEFHKVNGQIISVKVTFPRTGGGNGINSNYVELTERSQVESLELQMTSMLKDLQYVMEQMPVYESTSPEQSVRPLPE